MTRVTIRAVLEPPPSGPVSLPWAAPTGPGPEGLRGSRPEGLGAYAAGIFTAEPSSTEGALTLLLPIGARGIGMGRAVTASPGPSRCSGIRPDWPAWSKVASSCTEELIWLEKPRASP